MYPAPEPGSPAILRLALAGDVMVSRDRARLADDGASPRVADDVRAVLAEADVAVGNLECCLSTRGTPRPGIVFRAPPASAEWLAGLGFHCLTLANNHVLDYGPQALEDTIACLADAGIATVGAGPDVESARASITIERDGTRLTVIACCDHPAEWAAGSGSPGVAHARLDGPVDDWLTHAIAAADTDAILVAPHWGPNLTTRPIARVRSAAAGLVAAGATLVAGHSAHVAHGVAGRVLFDLGDFFDDGTVGVQQRRALGLLWLVCLTRRGVGSIEAVPLALDRHLTRMADADETRWLAERMQRACARMGTAADLRDGRLHFRPGDDPVA